MLIYTTHVCVCVCVCVPTTSFGVRLVASDPSAAQIVGGPHVVEMELQMNDTAIQRHCPLLDQRVVLIGMGPGLKRHRHRLRWVC